MRADAAPPTLVAVATADVARRFRCLNCDASLGGPFCAECGQHDANPRPTMRQLMRELAEESLSIDGKVVRTLRDLMRPGVLTEACRRGRRVPYVSPLRTYLLCSALFFFVMAVTPKAPAVPGAKASASATPVVVSPRPETALNRWMKAHRGESIARAKADPEGVRARVLTIVPWVAIILWVPLIALVFQLLFWDRSRFYPEYLVFTLHLHSFALVTLSVVMLDTFRRSWG